MAKSTAKIILGEKALPAGRQADDKIKKFEGHVYPEDIEKAQIEGFLGIVADSINYRDFLKLKNRGEGFYLEVDRFGE